MRNHCSNRDPRPGRPPISLFAVVLLLAACTGPLFGSRLDLARDIASGAGLAEFRIDTGDFVLTGFRANRSNAKTLALYIEGDGFIYERRSRPSTDPTPLDPIGLRLAAVAARHAGDDTAVVYLARPCQYLRGDGDVRRCAVPYWTLHRYAPDVVKSYQTAVATLMSQYGTTSVDLYGYSGGGTVAALLAGTLGPNVRLTTFAAVLDIEKWTAIRGFTPLDGSLNPADVAGLAQVQQTHYLGEDDDRIPLAVAQSYVSRIGGMARDSLYYAPNTGHECCWDDFWESGFATR